jgi:hypothetical protein
MKKTRPTAPKGENSARMPAPHPRQSLIEALRAIILAADGRIQEGVKWNAPSFYATEHFATFHLRAPDAVRVILHLGAKARPDAKVREALGELSDPFAWKGSDRAMVTFRDIGEVRRFKPALTRVIRRWIEHVR